VNSNEPDPKARPTAHHTESISPHADRFVFLPLRFRREHRDWSDAEHAAWLDLFLASIEVDGTFDSVDVARAYLGPRGDALDALIARGAIVEVDGTWALADFLELYDGRRPRHYKTLAQRLADADAKQARGEPLLSIERWARWKARQKARAVQPDEEGGLGSKELDRANVGQTLANDGSDPIPLEGNLYEVFEQRTGLPATIKEKSDIDAMCRKWDRMTVRRAMHADADPQRNPDRFMGRLWHRLKEGEVAA
jgi:hypothetical protein